MSEFANAEVKKSIKVVFTDDETKAHGLRLANLLQERFEAEVAQKATQQAFKAHDAELESEAIRLKDAIRNGHEYVTRNCYLSRDYAAGLKYYRDVTTGELLLEEPLDPVADSQLSIDEQGGIIKNSGTPRTRKKRDHEGDQDETLN